ncbi:SUF system Fe-S cluster assembly regulator [Marinihelvus fidelis]|uniref:SUF system Fe-S cluster assembly regulator n=1 Tax=Marinihelvus fidelis TaxID=2613842 RepID=A0A5N0TJB8_9GAMM|nr:SUF system Fe-S cluster assembly regulator [Marinihelvus fidelis]KAA9133399.1 SUF system Fe-S cluster assembly regulator [Marinihelvus fidelis]
MLRISKLADYAILLMVELAASGDEVLSAQALADRAGIELPTASKILKLLASSGAVSSFRGARGGYRVERPAAEISVAEIIAAIEGPIAMTECSIHEGLCSVEASCNARENWMKISRAVTTALEQVSLADMAGAPDSSAGIGELPKLRIATLV